VECGFPATGHRPTVYPLLLKLTGLVHNPKATHNVFLPQQRLKPLA
jgi:hypothetical protein